MLILGWRLISLLAGTPSGQCQSHLIMLPSNRLISAPTSKKSHHRSLLSVAVVRGGAIIKRHRAALVSSPFRRSEHKLIEILQLTSTENILFKCR